MRESPVLQREEAGSLVLVCVAFPVVCPRVICCPLKPRVTHCLSFLTHASLRKHLPILSDFKGGRHCHLRHVLFTVLWMSSAYNLPGKEEALLHFSSPHCLWFLLSPLSLGCEHTYLSPSLYLSFLFLAEGKLTISQSDLRKVSRRSPYFLCMHFLSLCMRKRIPIFSLFCCLLSSSHLFLLTFTIKVISPYHSIFTSISNSDLLCCPLHQFFSVSEWLW